MAPTGINRPGYSSSPTGINRPGYSSPKPPTGVNRPGRNDNDWGPNIVMKSKPNVPPVSTFKQPPITNNFAPTTSSQARKEYYDRLGAGPAPLQDILNITQRYKRAADIPGYQAKMKDYEAFQNAQKNDGIARFSQGPLAGQQILSMREPTLTAMAPTGGQFMGDIGRGFGDIIRAGAEFVTGGGMLGNIFKGIGGFFKPGEPGSGTTAPNSFIPARGGRDNNQSSMNTQTQEYQNLNATQQSIYNMLVNQGLNHAAALAQAMMQKPATNPYLNMINRLRGNNQTTMANGGIVKLS
jgi:hypothetical protein